MIQYQSGELKAVLNDLHINRLTGLVKITTSTEPARIRWLMLKNGNPTFCGTTIPTAKDFVLYLSRRLAEGRTEASVRRLLVKHPNVDSISTLLAMLTRLRLLKWEDIETLVSMDTAMHLEVVSSFPGTLSMEFESSDRQHPFDLCFGRSHHALDWTTIWTLVKVRQKMWQRISGCIPSLDSVPVWAIDTLDDVDDIAARDHLLKWIDGQQSLVAIAQAMGEDPLFLGRSYMSWVERGWLRFADSNLLHSPVLLSIHTRPQPHSLLDHFLEKRYQMRFANSVKDALVMMHMYDVGLALLEVNASGIDCIDLCHLIRQSPKFMELPLVLLAPSDASILTLKGQLTGPTHLLTNPPKQEALARIIDQYVYPETPGHHYISKPLMTRKASEFLSTFLLNGVAS